MTKKILFAAAAKKLLLAASAAWLLAAPAGAEELVYLTDPAGEALFMDSELRSDYFPLASYLEAEQVLTFCGPATIAAVMNSLGVERPQPRRLYPWSMFTQDSVFTPENQKVKPYAKVEHDGLVLPQLATFFENLGVAAEYRHADEFDDAWLRDTVKQVLADPKRRLVANYSRRPIGQDGDGHISPVAAYDEDTDKVLVLDVAKYKYPPVWLTVAELHEAMMAVDPSANKPRGVVIVSVADAK